MAALFILFVVLLAFAAVLAVLNHRHAGSKVGSRVGSQPDLVARLAAPALKH